jgi:hypothetical protein
MKTMTTTMTTTRRMTTRSERGGGNRAARLHGRDRRFRSLRGQGASTRADQRVLHGAGDSLLVQQVAESRDPVFAAMGSRTQHRIDDSGPVRTATRLIAVDFFDAKVERMDLVRVDQDRRDTRASRHGGRRRAGKTQPMIAMSTSWEPGRVAQFCAGNGKYRLGRADQTPELMLS